MYKSRKKKKKTEPKRTRAEIKLGGEEQAPDRRRCEKEIGSTTRIKIGDGARERPARRRGSSSRSATVRERNRLDGEDQAPNRRRCERETGLTARIKLQICNGARERLARRLAISRSATVRSPDRLEVGGLCEERPARGGWGWLGEQRVRE